VVMGVGFVGAVMAAVIADTVDKKSGKPSKFVIGCDLPNERSFWKIPMVNPRRVAGQGRGSGSRSDDRPLREREEDTDGHVQQRMPQAGPTASWSTCSATTPSTRWATMRNGRDGDGRLGSNGAHHRSRRFSRIV